ncbi:unnamed protein product [Mytilus coruscus]|uniref:Integrase catalytic domain-containing protein n=1 Tax=Mytilus coruscus TaxID=42192 RepID=A0A6J8CF73_MYTCO|nr:unnamed protein product [Mytilus coruscus]
MQASLKLKEEAVPKFFKPRPIPYALRDKVADEIKRLEKQGILEKIKFSEWGAPIVPVMKPDGSVRICGDYKVTINSCLEVPQYPLPKSRGFIFEIKWWKFIPDMSTVLQPLNELLTKKSKWNWNENCKKSFLKISKLLSSTKVLAHYDPNVNVELAVDASPYGLACQNTQSPPPAATANPWIWPSKPWQRVHIYFCGPFLNEMFLIVVDAHSKWIDVIRMSSTTSEKTINALRCLFSSHGIPPEIVSDNGPQFTSSEFETFLKKNRVKPILSAPYHPTSNGEAESC